MMTCCPQFERLMDRDLARHAQPYRLSNGAIVTEIDTEYFLVFGEERHQYVGLNYCPYRGRVLSRKLWNFEKKE
jgi:hypothetical protein